MLRFTIKIKGIRTFNFIFIYNKNYFFKKIFKLGSASCWDEVDEVDEAEIITCGDPNEVS